MKMIIALGVLVAIVAAAPQGHPDRDAVITRYNSDNIGLGRYEFAFETSNQISHQETGEIEDEGTENESNKVVGQYSYPGPDGKIYTVIYIADKNGFQPQGDHLPR